MAYYHLGCQHVGAWISQLYSSHGVVRFHAYTNLILSLPSRPLSQSLLFSRSGFRHSHVSMPTGLTMKPTPVWSNYGSTLTFLRSILISVYMLITDVLRSITSRGTGRSVRIYIKFLTQVLSNSPFTSLGRAARPLTTVNASSSFYFEVHINSLRPALILLLFTPTTIFFGCLTFNHSSYFSLLLRSHHSIYLLHTSLWAATPITCKATTTAPLLSVTIIVRHWRTSSSSSSSSL